MKIKANLIVSAVGILQNLDTTAMKLSTSYKVKTVLALCKLSVEDFETKRIELASKHGTLSEDKSHYEFKEEGSQDAFQSDMAVVLNDEIDMGDMKLIPLTLIDDYINISPYNVKFVEWFIDFDA